MQSSLMYNHKGFTLIETLFAVLIFSASLVSLMTIAGRGISAATTAREQTVAQYLAQEGVEIVRNIRDTAFLTSGWSQGFDTCTETDPCHVTYGNNSTIPPVLTPCTVSDPAGCVVYENADAFVDTGTPSIYFRKIYAVPMGTQDNTGNYTEYKVVSEITWTSKNIQRNVAMQTLLKKWK